MPSCLSRRDFFTSVAAAGTGMTLAVPGQMPLRSPVLLLTEPLANCSRSPLPSTPSTA